MARRSRRVSRKPAPTFPLTGQNISPDRQHNHLAISQMKKIDHRNRDNAPAARYRASLTAEISAMTLDGPDEDADLPRPTRQDSEESDEVIFVGKKAIASQTDIKSGGGQQKQPHQQPQPQLRSDVYQTRHTSRRQTTRNTTSAPIGSLDDDILQDYMENLRQFDNDQNNDQNNDHNGFAFRTLGLEADMEVIDPGHGAASPSINIIAQTHLVSSSKISDVGEGSFDGSDSSDIGDGGAESDRAATQMLELPVGISPPHVEEFDLLDLDRPSLQKRKKKGKLAGPPLVDDAELQAVIDAAWEQDREKKKARKAERELLRSQGLLGKGKLAEAEDYLSSIYQRGISRDELIREIITFCSSQDQQQIQFPPLDKHARKCIHDVSQVLGLASKSFGQHPNRFLVMKKRAATAVHVDASSRRQMEKILFRPHYARPSIGSSRESEEKKQTGRRKKRKVGVADRSLAGTSPSRHHQSKRREAYDSTGAKTRRQGNAFAGYLNGEIVGASAPEIGSSNRGRNMLEKMGWETGMALGADNQGLLAPIEHVVRNTRAGLG